MKRPMTHEIQTKLRTSVQHNYDDDFESNAANDKNIAIDDATTIIDQNSIIQDQHGRALTSSSLLQKKQTQLAVLSSHASGEGGG